jgi:predicted DCC family thiol-disulfide oxidoreductase YuxK
MTASPPDPAAAAGVRVYYDGSCGLCHRTVRFLVARDVHARLRYAPLGGSTFLAETRPAERSGLPDSVVVRLRPGAPLLVRSQAVAVALQQLGGAWGALGSCLRRVPAPLSDLVYRWVAVSRRKLFRPPGSACPLLSREQSARFDP